jgi:hypothetical protein
MESNKITLARCSFSVLAVATGCLVGVTLLRVFGILSDAGGAVAFYFACASVAGVLLLLLRRFPKLNKRVSRWTLFLLTIFAITGAAWSIVGFVLRN